MQTAVGLFTSREDAQRAVDRLRAIGLAPDAINVLAPGASVAELEAVPKAETEQPGVGPALGAVVGGAAGATGGIHLALGAATAASIPGVGPVVASGLIAGALLGVGAGAAIGKALDDTATAGLPKDELFLYEDALRRGRIVIIALARDDDQAEAARRVFTEAGAESLDAARERWWIGLRSAEAEQYTTQGRDFQQDELSYRRGFEAALQAKTRGKSYEDVVEYLRARYPDVYRDEAFRRGFERGRTYHLGLKAAS